MRCPESYTELGMFREDASSVPDYRLSSELRVEKAKFNGQRSLLEVLTNVHGIILKAQRGFAHGQGHQIVGTTRLAQARSQSGFDAIVRVRSVPPKFQWDWGISGNDGAAVLRVGRTP